ncbi:MAG TPA: EthD domain-containing protein [Ramlibacter sp.]|nr:EthD domain-containing protein [Ramlibacter sp.]
MITRFGMAPRKAGLQVAEFQDHWRTTHAQLAAGIPGFRRYWQNHALLQEGENLLPWPGFDVCSQIEADSIADFDRAFSSPHYLEAVRADERRFIDTTGGGYMLCERAAATGALFDAAPAGQVLEPVRLLTFLRLAPMASSAALGELLCAQQLAPSATGREVFLAFHGGTLGGQRYSIFEALEILWFADAGAALRHVVSAPARAQRLELAALVRGTERLVARVHTVV